MASDEASPLDRSSDHSAPPTGPTERVREPENGASTSDKDEPSPSTRDRFFNPFRTARTDEAHALVNEVRSDVEGRELRLKLRQRRRRTGDKLNHEKAVAAIVADVLHHHWAYPGDWLAVRLSNKVLSRKSQYRSPVMGEPLRLLVDGLGALGWIERVKGHRSAATARATTIRAMPRLVDRAVDLDLDFSDFGTDPDEEVIILKPRGIDRADKTKQIIYDTCSPSYLPYADTRETRRYRDEVRRINAWLADAEISYRGDEWIEEGRFIDVHQRRSRRVFNGLFTEGGRLYDGFWLGIKKENRHKLRIDGCATKEFDYGQMAIRTVYQMAGSEFTGHDAYAVPGFKKHRNGIKKLINAMLYASKPLTQFPRGSRELFSKDADLRWLLSHIERLHAPIKDYFYRGVGLEAMFIESQVIVGVLLRLTTSGAGKGLNSKFCRNREERHERHGSPYRTSYTAAQLTPHRKAALKWLAANAEDAAVRFAINAVVDLFYRAGPRVEAFRLVGKPPGERARAVWAALRDRKVHAQEVVAVWLAVEATIEADPQEERKTEFKRVQAAKVLHRMAGGAHKRWEIPKLRGGTIVKKFDKHTHSRGRVLRHLGAQLERAADVAVTSFMRHHNRETPH